MAYFKMILTSFAALLIIETAAVEYYAYKAEPENYDPIAKYSFQYAVQDDHTGDVKSQKETREGDSVKGYYSLVQPDGKKRIVEYSASKKTGFVANVRYEGGHDYVYAPNHRASSPPNKLAVKYMGNSYEAPKFKAPKYEAPKYEEPKQDEFQLELSKFESPKFDAFKYGSAKLELPEFKDLKIIPATFDFSNFEAPKYEAPNIDFSKYLKTNKVEAPKTAELKANPSYSDIFSSPLLGTPYFHYKL